MELTISYILSQVFTVCMYVCIACDYVLCEKSKNGFGD